MTVLPERLGRSSAAASGSSWADPCRLPDGADRQALGIPSEPSRTTGRSIYRKLDITTERELFLRYFEAERQ
jgi:hypothetical protein